MSLMIDPGKKKKKTKEAERSSPLRPSIVGCIISCTQFGLSPQVDFNHLYASLCDCLSWQPLFPFTHQKIWCWLHHAKRPHLTPHIWPSVSCSIMLALSLFDVFFSAFGGFLVSLDIPCPCASPTCHPPSACTSCSTQAGPLRGSPCDPRVFCRAAADHRAWQATVTVTETDGPWAALSARGSRLYCLRRLSLCR